MRAVLATTLTGPDGLRTGEIAEPDGRDRVVVDVRYAGVAFPDLLRTRGRYQVRSAPPFVPGAEAAGIVRSAPELSGFYPGQRVAVIAEGTWQLVVAADPAMVFPLPDGIPLATAAGLPLNHFTAHCALVRRARARPGETVLVHGAAGGVGSAALGLCRALDLRAIAVVSSGSKIAFARTAGATEVVCGADWAGQVRFHTAGRGVDVVLDPVGGDRFTESLRLLAPEGRLVVLGFTGGAIPEAKVNRLLLRNTAVLGAGWGEIAVREPDYSGTQWTELVALLERGRLVFPEPEVLPFTEAGAALRRLEDRAATGKIVLAFHQS
ncbi:NADPH:quinone oxidoreductase family protein [Amycolatopsis sp. ATCC 39116]|uniref:NADPH:quinone oxidoreductase family protein n=1 Tax=Amycolatopsis sp. (strain ATCC 39116 / 75iv2) TaxID=385957 RepID=UPI0002625D42|nr:NADPH:quinone oxidoreductase family protein [Amycolatopsis sp. ATCC 39116]